VLEEKFDSAQGNGDAAGGVILDIFDMQEILSKLFLRDQIWGFVKVLRELSNGCMIVEDTPTGFNLAVLSFLRSAFLRNRKGDFAWPSVKLLYQKEWRVSLTSSTMPLQ
jgi:hypothetical protein